LTLLMLHRSVGAPAMAWGFLVSSLLQASVTLVPVLAHGWRRLMPLSSPRVREIVRLMAPIVLFGVLIHAVSLFERYYASGLPDGELTYLGYATKISDMVVALLGTGIATAIFPTMTKKYVRSGTPGLVDTVEYGVRLTLALALPALAVISSVALPLMDVLLERGAFSNADTLSVSRVLPVVMASGLVMAMVGGLVSQAFFVIKDTYSVSILAALASGLYIPLAGLLAGIRGYVGLAWARLLCSALPVVVLLMLLTRRLGLNLPRVLKHFVSYAFASAVAALGAWMTNSSLRAMPATPRVLGAVAVGGVIYAATLWPIDGETARALLEMTGLRGIVAGARAVFGFD
ncbi:MAG: lipid II flippase MurJ, partial [Anaerolineae bacterium]